MIALGKLVSVKAGPLFSLGPAGDRVRGAAEALAIPLLALAVMPAPERGREMAPRASSCSPAVSRCCRWIRR